MFLVINLHQLKMNDFMDQNLVLFWGKDSIHKSVPTSDWLSANIKMVDIPARSPARRPHRKFVGNFGSST